MDCAGSATSGRRFTGAKTRKYDVSTAVSGTTGVVQRDLVVKCLCLQSTLLQAPGHCSLGVGDNRAAAERVIGALSSFKNHAQTRFEDKPKAYTCLALAYICDARKHCVGFPALPPEAQLLDHPVRPVGLSPSRSSVKSMNEMSAAEQPTGA